MTPLVLGFDTSGPWCGAVLLQGDTVLADYHDTEPRGQAERLMGVLEDVLTRGGANWKDLTAIGVGVGPGNFTGIRLSVSAARGLSLSLNIPAVGISLLDALLLDAPEPSLACIQAPRDQVYVQSAGLTPSVEAHLTKAETLDYLASKNIACIGSGAELVANFLNAQHNPAKYAPASAVARLARDRFPNATGRPTPLYLKAPDAAPSRHAAPKILP